MIRESDLTIGVEGYGEVKCLTKKSRMGPYDIGILQKGSVSRGGGKKQEDVVEHV